MKINIVILYLCVVIKQYTVISLISIVIETLSKYYEFLKKYVIMNMLIYIYTVGIILWRQLLIIEIKLC